MSFDPASALQDLRILGEFGGVNPSISDSSTFTFAAPEAMSDLFIKECQDGYLYARHWSPSTRALATALAAMEDTAAAVVTASGMAAISAVLLQLCDAGDEIVCGRTVYGGTYALLRQFLPRLGIYTRFVDPDDSDGLLSAINPRTRVLYVESISNPLLEVADLPALSRLAQNRGLTLVVDNTFSPMIVSPARLGADVVIHSLTKFINGHSDGVAGAICGSTELISRLTDVGTGAAMLLGPVLDSLRAASIFKNLRTLPLRLHQHGNNALFLARALSDQGLTVHYPGLPAHPHHDRLKALMNPSYGYGGLLVLDVGDAVTARQLTVAMQDQGLGHLAVSLGFTQTLFSLPGTSTSSEIPPEDQVAMGLRPGMIRLSVGLDHDIGRTFDRLRRCLVELELIDPVPA